MATRRTEPRTPPGTRPHGKPRSKPRSKPGAPVLIRMGELSRRSGVPASTIKYYMREGLLPGATVATTRNSALYDPALVDNLERIKRMQEEQFLPLWRIKEVLSAKADGRLETVVGVVDRAFARPGKRRPVRRSTLLARGVSAAELDELTRRGLFAPGELLTGDDAELAGALVAAHQAGLTERLDVVEVLDRYRAAVRRLVNAELDIFAGHILGGAGDQLGEQTARALEISERLVRILRRRLLLPELQGAVDAAAPPRRRAAR